MSSYKCLNCNYQCKTFNDMVKHLNRQTICKKCLGSYNYTDEELIKLSLIPCIDNTKDNTNNIDINKIREKFKNIKNKLTKKKYFEQFNIIEKNKLRSCPICNKNYKLKYELKNHLILDCVTIDFEKLYEIPINLLIDKKLENIVEENKDKNCNEYGSSSIFYEVSTK